MGKKIEGLDKSAEARAKRTEAKREEMERQGCPFGRYPNGIPRTRPEIPPELRSYYVVFGMPKHGSAAQRLGRFKSQLSAARWIEQTHELLANNYTGIELVRCKRVRYSEIG